MFASMAYEQPRVHGELERREGEDGCRDLFKGSFGYSIIGFILNGC